MKLREITIKNFRCLVDITFPVSDLIVLVGENNSGKSALIDALKVALTHVASSRQHIFDEYDYHMCNTNDSPQTCDGIVIELWFQEDKADEWPDSIFRALTEIIQTDPIEDIDSIGLRVSSKYNETIKEMETTWEFLTLDGTPLVGRGASYSNLQRFFSYMRFYCLSALRDSSGEFSPRSQFWGKLLRDLKISEEQRIHLNEELEKINKELLEADPKLEQVRLSLDRVHKVMSLGTAQSTSIQAMPLKPWDLMSKSQVVMKTRGNDIEFPLLKHGQGMQSLAIIFLFQAYIDVALKPSFYLETEAILALEEPEAHLHPQAIRALSLNLGEIKSQKIISCHSPYFIQEIPFSQIRMFRRVGPCTKVFYIRKTFTVSLPQKPELLEFCKNNEAKYSYHSGKSLLTSSGKVKEEEFRKLLTIFPGQNDIHQELKRFKDESQIYLSENDLNDLDTYVKRIRGDILFGRAWLLCEGQSEYLLLRYFAEIMGMPLDKHGVTVIDFQNNGSPGAFISLARVFDIPWVMICDNDDAGKNYVEQAQNRGVSNEMLKELVHLLPDEGMELEDYLIDNGFIEEYKEILSEYARNTQPRPEEYIIAELPQNRGKETQQIILKNNEEYEIRILKNHQSSEAISRSHPEYSQVFRNILASEIKKDRYKMKYTNALIKNLRKKNGDRAIVPPMFINVIEKVVEKTK